MSNPTRQPLLSSAIKQSWRRFLDEYEPQRPDLYRYCRHLTHSPWDAEDMAQETLARAFVTLGISEEPPANARAWLFRVASNLWLNQARKARPLRHAPSIDGDEAATKSAPDQAVPSHEARALREAAGTVFSQLTPQERAALVLKDAFGLSLEETAETLSTSSGAIKAALHRGRGKLATPEAEPPAKATPAVLDAFCEAFNSRDLGRLTALLLDNATMEYPGIKLEVGAKAIETGSFQGTLFGCPEGRHELAATPRCEVRAHRGECLLLWWSGDEVHAVVRVALETERVARLYNYFHAPELLTELCRELDVPCCTHGYHPGAAWFAEDLT